MSKIKMKWWREGVDNHENLYLVPVDKIDAEDDEGDEINPSDHAVAWIDISYNRTRFYHGRGGEGTSRPDSYIAYVKDGSKDRIVEEGANVNGDAGSILDTKIVPAFSTIRAAKAAINRALAALEARAQWAPSSTKPCTKSEPCTKGVPCLVHVDAASERVLSTPEARAAELATVQSDVDMAGPSDDNRDSYQEIVEDIREEREMAHEAADGAWGKEHLTGYAK
jgi:hypothetical protein